MMRVELVRWNKGLKTVSLIEAVKAYGNVGLAASKKLVDDFLGGQSFSVECTSDEKAAEFKQLAEDRGAVCKLCVESAISR